MDQFGDYGGADFGPYGGFAQPVSSTGIDAQSCFGIVPSPSQGGGSYTPPDPADPVPDFPDADRPGGGYGGYGGLDDGSFDD